MKKLILILMLFPLLIFGQSKIRNTQITSGNATNREVLTSDGATNAIWDSVRVSGLVGDIPLFYSSVGDTIIQANVEYGALYNWYAATDSRKITSSDDWVVPTWSNMLDLLQFLQPGATSINSAGGKLKETGLTYWSSPNAGATNEFGFNGKGSGYRNHSDGSYDGASIASVYLSITEYNPGVTVSGFGLAYYNNIWIYSLFSPKRGASIRLLYTGSGTPTYYQGNDLKLYNVVTIGTQTWLAENLNETKYRNGDWITGFDGGVYTPISNANWAAKTTEAMCYYNDLESNGGTAIQQIITQDIALGDTLDLSGLVPYRNAKDTLLTPKPIKAPQFISDTTYVKTGLEETGSSYWDSANQTYSDVLENGVTGQRYEELFISGQNDTGATLPNGAVVAYDSSIGNSGNMRIHLTTASATEPTFMTLGILTHEILNGGVGKITTYGKVREIQTDGANYGETWVDGDILYKSSTIAGGLTKVPPEAPIPAIPIASVISAHATNGTLFVRPTYPTSLQMLTDVNGTPLTSSGQFPVWDETNGYFDFTENINNYKHSNYCPTNLTVNKGTLNQGTVADICAIGGSDVIVQEVNGADPLRVTLSFSNVERLTSFVFYGRYSGGAGHVLFVEAYNYTTASWQLLGELGTNATKQWYSYNIFLPTNYVSGGVVQVRINHQSNGVNTHQLILDYVDINYGGGGGSSFQTASEIGYVPSGNIGSTNVQNAITELDSEKQPLLTNPVTGNTTPFTTNALIKATGTGNQVAASGVIVDGSNNITASSFIKSGGLSTQFLKADGSVDTNVAPASGSANYVQVSPASAQSGNIWMGGNVTTKGSIIITNTDSYQVAHILPAFGSTSDYYGLRVTSPNATNPEIVFQQQINGLAGGISNTLKLTSARNAEFFGGATFGQVITAPTAKFTTNAGLGKIFTSDNLGNGDWQTVNQVIGGNALTSGYLPYWDGGKLVNSQIKTNGVDYGYTIESSVFGGANAIILKTNNSINPNSTISWVDQNGVSKVRIGSYFNIADNGIEFIKSDNTTSVSISSVGIFRVHNLASTSTRLVTASATGQLANISDGTSGQFLKTDGAGGYSFGNATLTTGTSLFTIESDSILNVKYGFLYNWYAATDTRKISSSDSWEVPTSTDFSDLVTYLGGASIAGGKLKETGLTYWNSPNTGATNEYGFNARGGGLRGVTALDASFGNFGDDFYFWSSTAFNATTSVQNNITTYDSRFYIGQSARNWWGMSLRLKNSSTTLAEGESGIYIGNNGYRYRTIVINGVEWLADNLCETEFRNGETIDKVTDATSWAALTTDGYCAYDNTDSNAFDGWSVITTEVKSGDTIKLPTKGSYIENGTTQQSANFNVISGQMQKAVFTPGVQPESIEGTIYYDTTTKHFYGYDGTTWKQLDN